MKNYCDYCVQEQAEFYWGEEGPNATEGSLCCSKCSEIHGLTFLLEGLKCVPIAPSVTAERVRVQEAQYYAKNSILNKCIDKMPKKDTDSRAFQYENNFVVCTYVKVFNSLKSRPKLILHFRIFDELEAQYDSVCIGVIDLQTWKLELLFDCQPGSLLKEVISFIQGDAIYYLDKEA